MTEQESTMVSPGRPLTEQERTWLLQGLATLAVGEQHGGGRWTNQDTGEALPLESPVDPTPFIHQIDELRVVEKRESEEHRCVALVFQHGRVGHSVGLVTGAESDDGRTLVICIDDETGKLAELEVMS